MVMSQPGPAFPAPNSERGLAILRMVWIEILFEIRDHLFTRVTVNPQEGMVIANAVDTLSDGLLIQGSRGVFP